MSQHKLAQHKYDLEHFIEFAQCNLMPIKEYDVIVYSSKLKFSKILMRITTTSLLVPVNKESKESACMHIQFVEEVGLIV